jgi:hypothetical protein
MFVAAGPATPKKCKHFTAFHSQLKIVSLNTKLVLSGAKIKKKKEKKNGSHST